MTPNDPFRMTPQERTASLSLAGLFALRMLGLFIVLPVFAIEAAHYPGGDNASLVGFAMGIYGLVQAMLQIPLGLASDRWGRKPVILLGLAVFVLGSVVAMQADSLMGLLLGRAIQGAGAISAAVTALLADVTRPQVRTKAMALVGMSIAAMFVLSLFLAPIMAEWAGLPGLFALTAALALAGMLLLFLQVPEPVRQSHDEWVSTRSHWQTVWRHAELRRLNFGVFSLHAVQIAMWVVIPGVLLQSGWSKGDHWQLYLPAVMVSILVVGGVLFRLERKGHIRWVLRFSVALLVCVQLGWWWATRGAQHDGVSTPVALALLTGFFVAFNALESSQPSLTSKMAPAHLRGLALGVFNTLQSLGFFIGGALGGALLQAAGPGAVFLVCAAWLVLWLFVTWNLRTEHAQH